MAHGLRKIIFELPINIFEDIRMNTQAEKIEALKITSLLKQHTKLLVAGLIAVIGEGVANLLEPWPLKVVLDNVLKPRPAHGWLNGLIFSIAGEDKLEI